MVVALCKNGADKDKADCDGWTPLLIAYRMMHVDAARLLGESGAEEDRVDEGGEPPVNTLRRV